MNPIDGPAGTVYVNTTDKILWQYQCQFRNSCGRCIQFAGLIGPWWPLPLHRRCNCRNVPVPPGESAAPFVDFRKEVEELDPAQQAVVMGRSNYALVRSGKVDWKDVVHPRRVLNFREVVDGKNLSVAEMVRVGVSPVQARNAVAVVRSPEILAADRRRIELVRILEAQGMTRDAIAAAVAKKLAARVGVAAGPSGPSGPLFSGRPFMTAAELALLGLDGGFRPPEPEERRPLTPEERDALDRVVLDFLGFEPEAEPDL